MKVQKRNLNTFKMYVDSVIVVFECILERAMVLPFSKSVTKDSESNVSSL